MDYREYREVYNKLITDGPDSLGSKDAEKINEFLAKFPKAVPKDRDPEATFVQLSLKEIFRRSIRTAIDIITDLSKVLGDSEAMSNTELRREIFKIFTAPERRLYVGVWLIFLAFVLYFVDSAA